MHNFREISCPKLQLIDFSVGRDAAMGQSDKVTELMPKGASVNKEEEAVTPVLLVAQKIRDKVSKLLLNGSKRL